MWTIGQISAWPVALLVVLGAGSAARAQQIFKHVDENGRVTFSTGPSAEGARPYEIQAPQTDSEGAQPIGGHGPHLTVTRGRKSTRYDLNWRGDVTRSRGPDGDFSFEYDKVGNLIREEGPRDVIEYEYGPDRGLMRMRRSKR